MREGAVAHKRRARIKRKVCDLADKPRCRAQLSHLLRTEDAVTKFQFQIGNDRAEVSIPATFAVAIDRALHVDASGRHGGQGVSDSELSIVMAMNAERHVYLFDHFARHSCNCLRQTPAISVAQHDALWATSRGRS